MPDFERRKAAAAISSFEGIDTTPAKLCLRSFLKNCTSEYIKVNFSRFKKCPHRKNPSGDLVFREGMRRKRKRKREWVSVTVSTVVWMERTKELPK
jgi:hypothetical protein